MLTYLKINLKPNESLPPRRFVETAYNRESFMKVRLISPMTLGGNQGKERRTKDKGINNKVKSKSRHGDIHLLLPSHHSVRI